MECRSVDPGHGKLKTKCLLSFTLVWQLSNPLVKKIDHHIKSTMDGAGNQLAKVPS